MTKIAKNRDFSGEDLRNVKADGWVFVKCNFDRADLSNSSFKDSRFISCSFDRSSLDQSNLEGTSFCDDDVWLTLPDNYPGELDNPAKFGDWPAKPPAPADSPNCTASLASFCRSNLHSTNFEGYNLRDSNFSEADLTNASFSRTRLDHCSFKDIRVSQVGTSNFYKKNKLFGNKVSLEFADFSYTNLAGVEFCNCKSLEAANFSRSDLSESRFEGENETPMCLYRACFDNTRLSKAEFNNCDLDSASFVSADLRQVKFLGSSHANAAIFINSYLAGCQAKGINFIAANFSGALVRTDKEEGVVPASFSRADLTSANFSGAALIGVNFDGAYLNLADFDSATFTAKPETNEDGSQNKKDQQIDKIQGMSFKGTKLEKAVFRNVNLNDYRFIDCNAIGAIFDKSELERVQFVKTILTGCSFDECYLSDARFFPEEGEESSFEHNKYYEPRLSLASATFARSSLSGAKFYHADLVNAEFTGADLSGVLFSDSNLTGADFKNSSLYNAKFFHSNLELANFEQVKFDKAKLISVQLNFAQFLRVRGKDVEVTDKENLPAQAVVFRLHDLTGKFDIKFSGSIVEHGSFSMSNDSDMSWENGLHCTGSSFIAGGILSFARGLIDNSRIDVSKCKKLLIDSSTVQSSYISGLSKFCSLNNTTFDSCNVEDGWQNALFNEAKINLTNLSSCNSDSEIEKIVLDDLITFDKNSISALRSNASSMGFNIGSDHFFALEKEDEIKRIKKEKIHRIPREKEYNLYIASFFLVLFIIFPASKLIFPRFDIDSWHCYLICISFISISGYCFYLSYRQFLNCIYGYGNKINRIFLSIAFIVLAFTDSIFINKLSNINKYDIDTIIKQYISSFHHSINSFVSIGFWGNSIVSGSDGIMVLYANIESFMGIVAMALLVATIIRRTAGR